jgi:hypothetical protein
LPSTSPPADLATLAQYGLRAELLFAVPAVPEANPYLLGYYRLLMGYSQKEFYGRDKGFGVGYFKSMEEKGKTSKTAAADLPDLCVAFCATASALLAGVGPLRVSRELLDDLTLLTVGPQLRGGANNQRGTDGIVQVFEIIREIVAHAAAEVRESAIEVNSATGRPFLIEFAPDPDIIIREEMEHQHYRNVGCYRGQERNGCIQHPQPHRRSGKEPPEGAAARLYRVLDGGQCRAAGHGEGPQRITIDRSLLFAGRPVAQGWRRVRRLPPPCAVANGNSICAAYQNPAYST